MATREKDYVDVGKQYAEQVVSGKIPACKWVRLACQRQLDDLQRKDWKWKFDRARGNRICAFAELLPHVKGRWPSKTFILEPWQCFVFTTLFGWIDAQGYRRFRKALVVLPRKNGKSALASIVGLYGLALDEEPGAEIYAAATTRDQAKVVWDVSRKMVQKTPEFADSYGIAPLAHSITVESEGSSFKPLSRDADSLEGLNPHFAIIDELHAHAVREVFDVLDEATGSRRQPLIFIISTEGDNAAGVFAEQVSYLQNVLEGTHEDDSYWGIIYTIDPEDDWVDRASWYKANPNLGVSVFENDLEIRCHQAQSNPESQASFLTKRLNVRVGTSSAYFNILAWDRICKDDSLQLSDFLGKPCVIGIDLASKKDLAAKVIRFLRAPLPDAVFAKFYLPEDACDRGHQNYAYYRGWAEKGILTLTPGNIIDYAFIERDLLEDMRSFWVQRVGVDPHDATQFNTRMLAQGVPILEVPQTVLALNEPMKELDARIVAGNIRHDGNPILHWCMANVGAKKDVKEHVFPRKARDENKIDGALALMNTEYCVLRDQAIVYMGGFAS